MPARDACDAEIFAAQVHALYQQIPMVLAVNVVNAALAAAVLGSYLGDIRWWWFFGFVAILTGARALLWVQYRGASRSAAGDARRWAALATIASVLSGILWGGASGLFFPDVEIAQIFLAFLIGGMCAGALVSLSHHVPAFLGYIVTATLPLAIRFLLKGDPINETMAALVVVFAIALTFASHNFARSFRRGFQLQSELRLRTDALSASNARLQAEIFERKAAEDQLHQVQKLEALGQLTGGIAHDFNNLLTAVIGHIELAQERVARDARTAGLLRGALAAAERGATLTQRLLAFARRQHLQPRSVDVSAVVSEIEKLLKQTIGPGIRLIVHSEPGLCPAKVDPDQLAVAILNLALNARDAMPAGGTLRIASAQREAHYGGAPKLPPGEYVVVSVSDTGTGMDKETAERAFEPFFTTKEVGRGSGLGLPMVQGFAAQSDGAIDLQTAVGQGTTIELWLPRADQSPPEVDQPKPAAAVPAARARIVVCDDDAEVRAFVSVALRERGYTVWEANDPVAALPILHREQPIDLLLADYAMPEMTGTVMIERARQCQPGLRAVLMTGHADGLQSAGPAGVPLLSKPFKVADLNACVVQALAGTRMHEGEVANDPAKRPVARILDL